MKIVELKESQKDIDLLQLMVDVTEQKILPASEKLLAQAKEFGSSRREVRRPAVGASAALPAHGRHLPEAEGDDAAVAAQARTLAATQWAKVSPKGADWVLLADT